ncbi:extracellular solute-binding protein family 5 [Catenulispora acidiphila DSM 44928]|uniref:Extracellular solute-binding protein family 5 n=1 Tax=Catenulispora acidiphila (strain DSM 44928 / JCM 14897 / NBRC 102108 / NRRL B-24433 / ID139908) TaxID=479433 RepID=C7QE15_CATAD|nr:ABC transporter family substrate-binding protein [Catenulispora acidiphila]ACU76603.1 extracellular solute-binding protein family 5 [Catenulispora acidiphila DSM 44928]
MGVSRRTLALQTGAIAAAVALAATACGSSKSGGGSTTGSGSGAGTPIADRNSVNAATVKQGGKITWTIEKTVQDWNPLTSLGNTFDYAQTTNGIYPDVYVPQPDYSLVLNTDLMAGDPVVTNATSTEPQKIVYKIQPNAKWSDGTPVTADDFIYLWQAQNGTNPNVDVASTTGYSDVASVTGSDNGKTVTVAFKQDKPFSDWKSLFTSILPAHVAKQHGDVAASFTWLDANPPTVSAGPFEIAPGGVSADKSLIKTIKNPQYYGKPANLDEVDFRAITDSSQEPTALANGEVDGIYPQPQLDLVNRVKSIAGVDYHINQGLVWEHIDLNLRNSAFGGPADADQTQPAKVALRQAMFTAFDRLGLLNRTIKQFDSDAAVLNNRMVVPGQPGYQDNASAMYPESGDLNKAKQLLTTAGYKGVGTALVDPSGKAVPAFSMRYTVGNQLRQDTCNLFAQAMKQLGITVNVSSTDALGKTLTQSDAQHTYDIIVFAWVDTPFPNSANQPLYTTTTQGNPQSNYGYYSNANVDKWLADATVNPDQTAREKDLNQADAQITKDAYTLPLYQKPTMIAYKNTLGNVRDNPTQIGPTYNIAQWGQK